MADPILEPYAAAIDEFPLTGSAQEKLQAAVRYAILAPSSHNTQPWLFRVGPGGLELYADRARALPVVDPADRALVMSCGAALYTLRVALHRFGCQEVVNLLPDARDEDLLARVTLDGVYEPRDEDLALFAAIPKRHTNRHPFEGRTPPTALVSLLAAAAVHEGAWLQVLEGIQRAMLADLIAQGDQLQMRDRRFRRELAAWMTPNRSRSRDGIPGYALGYGTVMSAAGPLVIRTFDVGKGQAAKNEALALGSPVLAVLGTTTDETRDWLVAGQALQHVLLRACVEGVSASFLNQPVEVVSLRTQLQVLSGSQGYPQLVLRLGYGEAPKATPRRPVEEVLLS